MTTPTQEHLYNSDETAALAMILTEFAKYLSEEQRNKISMAVSAKAAVSGEPFSTVLHKIGEQVLKRPIKLLQPPAK